MKLYQSIIIVALVLVLTALAGADDFESFSKDSRLDILSAPVRCFFKAASGNDSMALAQCFTENVTVNIAGMKFNGPAEVFLILGNTDAVAISHGLRYLNRDNGIA